jgi:hypothetical protein
MLDALTEYVLREWRVIKGAPLSFGICSILLGVLAFFIASWHYAEQIDTQKATIETQQSTIDNQKDRIDVQRDKLVELQRKSEGIHPQTTPISPPPALSGRLADQSNEELRKNATLFVENLRRFGARIRLQDDEASNADWAALATIPREDKKQRDEKWQEFIRKETNRSNMRQSQYDVEFRSGVISYKNEICKREEFISPCPIDYRMHMIDIGTVGGAMSVSDVADYLTLIINNLEND